MRIMTVSHAVLGDGIALADRLDDVAVQGAIRG